MCLALVALGAALGRSAPAPAEIELQEVAPGVFAALQPAAMRFDDSNSAVIVNKDSVIVVDTQVSPATARLVLEAIRRKTPNLVRTVINTHWHGDHIQGNQLYRDAFPGVEILAHANTREDVEKRGIPDWKEQLATTPGLIERMEQQLASGVTRSGAALTEEQKQLLRGRIERRTQFLPKLRQVTEIVVPAALREVPFTIKAAQREIRLLHFPGHTRGDLVVYLPAEKVLVTGDLLDDMPFTGHGSPKQLVETLRTLEKMDFNTIIPGHGSVRQGKDHLRQVLKLFESIVTQVDAAVAQGKDKKATVEMVNLDQFEAYFVHGDEVAARYWGAFMVAAAEKAFDEAAAAKQP